MPRFAAIDVGSNALRLRVIEAAAPSQAGKGRLSQLKAEGPWKDLATLRAPVRLGAEVFLSGRLAPASVGQACTALREFRQEIDRWKVDAYRAIATSAVREAKNGGTLVERARREAGIELETVEGIEEARLITLAVTRRIQLGEKRALLVDVGGGSTELTVLEGGETAFTMSLPLGTVRMLEGYLKGAKTVDRARERLIEEAIDRALGEALPQIGAIDTMVGTGGNVDTLCEMCPAKGSARGIDVAAAKTLFKKLCGMSNSERRDEYQLRPDRADTIVPAAAIFLRLASVLKMSTIHAPGVGLAAGVLEEIVDKFFHVWDAAEEAERILEACVRLGRHYHFDEKHARHVCRFATQLFDDLQQVHAFGERDRLLLRVAAILHDIGDFVHYSGHHKHSQYLILHADIMGITPEERAIVSNIARYHRKGPPDPNHPGYRDLGKEARGKVRGLAGILRIADALDREHKQKIESVRGAANLADARVTLFLGGEGDRELEEWTVRAKASLWRDEYDLDVEIAKAEVSG
jgi:exopolyphosphatase/guanosine-5'-triphosphate,3'-diphosphate pyrophosphatase